MTTTSLIPIPDGSEEFEAVCLIDVQRRAQVELTVDSVTKDGKITASRGTPIVADAVISDSRDQA